MSAHSGAVTPTDACSANSGVYGGMYRLMHTATNEQTPTVQTVI